MLFRQTNRKRHQQFTFFIENAFPSSFFNKDNKKSSGDLKLKLTAYKNVYTLFYRMLHLYTAQ